MALELERFFELCFYKNKYIEENKTDDKLLYYYEISIHKFLISDILKAIENELSNYEKYDFINNISNGWTVNQNKTEMNDFLLSNIKNINNYNLRSKKIIVNYLEILLSDNFERNTDMTRTILYFRKIINEILIKWKKNYYDHVNDITTFNNLLREHNIR